MKSPQSRKCTSTTTCAEKKIKKLHFFELYIGYFNIFNLTKYFILFLQTILVFFPL
jgi:hypothetical protein